MVSWDWKQIVMTSSSQGKLRNLDLCTTEYGLWDSTSLRDEKEMQMAVMKLEMMWVMSESLTKRVPAPKLGNHSVDCGEKRRRGEERGGKWRGGEGRGEENTPW